MTGCMILMFAVFSVSAYYDGVRGLNLTEAVASTTNTSLSKPNATQKPPQHDACYYFNPCLNQGKCISENSVSRSCACAPGYKGSRCQFVDFCHGKSCGEHGDCVSQSLGYICNCSGDYVGKHCEVVNPCLVTKCLNGGICKVDSNKAKCECSHPYAGKQCETQCRPTIRCYYIGGTLCVLRSNLTIKNCECTYDVPRGNFTCVMEDELENECETLGNPCNGGTCIDLRKGFKCRCYGSRSGSRCEIHNPCLGLRPACSNHGTCSSVSNHEYRCTCNFGYDGKDCQYRNNDTTAAGPPCRAFCTSTGMRVTCYAGKLPTVVRSATLHARIAEPRSNCTCTFPPEIESYRVRTSRYRSDSRWDSSWGYYRLKKREKQCVLPFSECGTKMQVKSGEIVYHNVLSLHEFALKQRTPDTWEQDSLITRKRPKFEIQVECKVLTHLKSWWNQIDSKDMETTNNTEIFANSSVGNFSMVTKYLGLNSTSKILQPITDFLIGERIYVLVRMSSDYNKNAELKGQELTLRNCYATASKNKQHEPLYYLLENGCVKDQTFRYENDLLQEQNNSTFTDFDFKTLISFEAFRFKDDLSKVFIQVEADICFKTSNCNSCNDAKGSARNRRNADLDLQQPYAGGSHFNAEVNERIGVVGLIQ